MKKLVTHSQGFHADDVLAYAILKEVLTKRGETWELERSRDPEVIKSADVVFDVGEEYDAEKNRYDHHQIGKAGSRPNGIMYASGGLVWKHFGRELCSNDKVWEAIDRGIFMEIDAVDNGQSYIKELAFVDSGYIGLGMHIANFENSAFEEKTPEIMLDSFEKASEFARGILMRAIRASEAFEQSFQEASEVYRNSEDKQILIFEKNYGRPIWKRMSEYPEPIYVVYKNSVGWKVETVPVTETVFEARKLFPEAWRGLKNPELSAAMGVSDAIFCHNAGFLLGTESKESALLLAKKALSA